MKIFYTIFLAILAALLITASVFLTIDGNLAKFTGWYRVTPGMPLFTQEHRAKFKDVAWFRLSDLNDKIECEKQSDGTWWIIHPYRDKLNPVVIEYLLAFAETTTIVDSLEMNDELRSNMRDFGFASDFCNVTLKVRDNDGYSTAARFTLGKRAPWSARVGDGKMAIPTTYLKSDFYGDDERIHVVSGYISELFDKGLLNLRDPMPLRFDPNQVSEISIARIGEAPITLLKESDNSPWQLKTTHNTSWANQEAVAKLIIMLYSLEATRVQDSKDVQLNGEPITTISIKDTANNKSTIRLYASTTERAEDANAAALCYATVEGRDVVFTLRAAPKTRRKGGYSAIINSVFSMPALPAEDMARLRGLNITYTDQLPLTISDLRSKMLATFDERDVECVVIRSANSAYPLRLSLIPGIQESNTQDAWTVEAEGKEAIEAETNIVRNMLKSFRAIPADAIVADLPTGQDEESLRARMSIIRQYGLLTPDYRIFITPRSCALRSTLYGIDLPLVKDRDVKIFSVTLHQDPETGEIERLAMQENGDTIYKVSHKLTKNFSMRQNHWRSRNLLSFHISELKSFTLGFPNNTLMMEYDAVRESWNGTLNNVDITTSINPVGAQHCVDRLRRLKVREWIDPYDSEALQQLSHPEFTVTVDLERVDYSTSEAIIADSTELGHDELDESGNYRQDGAGAILQEDNDLNDKFRDVAFLERPMKNQRYTIDFAPVNYHEQKPLFYGRVRETRQLFIISFEDAQSFGNFPIEGKIQTSSEE